MSDTCVITIELTNKYGLHARPAMQFVDVASKFEARVSVAHGDQEVDGKSIMGVMMLAAEHGTALTIKAEGTDAKAALDSLVELVESNFGEE